MKGINVHWKLRLNWNQNMKTGHSSFVESLSMKFCIILNHLWDIWKHISSYFISHVFECSTRLGYSVFTFM